MDAVEKLLKKIERTAKAIKRPTRTVAKDVLGDGKAYQQLIEGWRGITLKRIDEANAALDQKLANAKKKPSDRIAA